MNTENFHFHALSWLRDEMSVKTDCLPHEHVEEDDDGTAIVDGVIVDAPRGNPWFRGALWGFAASYGIGLAAGQPVGNELQTMLGLLAQACAVVTFVCVAAAIWRKRGRRKRVLVELHAEPQAVDAEEIRSVREEAARKDAWILSETGFTSDAVALAEKLRVRCFARREDSFTEVGGDAPLATAAW